MTSQLNVDTIVDKAGSGGSNVKMANTSTYVSEGGNVTQNTVQGLAKAWASYEMYSSDTIRGSFNVSSKADNGTGESTLSWTNSMQNGYVAGGASNDQIMYSVNGGRTAAYNANLTTSSGAFAVVSDSGTAYDSNVNVVSIHGDLA